MTPAPTTLAQTHITDVSVHPVDLNTGDRLLVVMESYNKFGLQSAHSVAFLAGSAVVRLDFGHKLLTTIVIVDLSLSSERSQTCVDMVLLQR
jgi:hypothetical protein